jgi:hypothetical protein
VALFNVSVLAHLQLPESVRRAIVQSAVSQERIAVALEAIVAKMNEPDPEVDPVLHEEITDAAAEAEALRQAQAPQAP